RRAGALPVRGGLGAAQTRGVVRQRTRGDPAAAGGSGAAALVGAGEPGAGAARLAGTPAARGDDVRAAAVRGFRAALAGRSPGGAERRGGGAARGAGPRAGAAAAGGPVGTGGAAGARAGLPAALAGRGDGRRRVDVGVPGRRGRGAGVLPPRGP